MKFLILVLFGSCLFVTQGLISQVILPEKRLLTLSASPSQQYFLFEQAIAFEEHPHPAGQLPGKSTEPVQPSGQDGQHEGHNREPSSEYPSLHMVGFGDVNFSAMSDTGSKSGFNEGQFVLHFASALSQKVSFVGELSFTARSDAGTGTPSAPGFNPEVERAIVRYDQSDYLKISLGRYHTPVNWWNTEFHHGLWLQTTISRPEMTKFGGQFIPVHFVGGLIEGAIPAAGLNINYNAGVGNGRGTVISRGGDAGDNNNNRAWLVNLFVKPDALFGLEAGGSVYRDRISPASGHEFGEWIVSGHLVWQKEDPEFIAEIANIQHTDITTNLSYHNLTYYVQLGYRLPWFESVLKPYVRYEYMKINEYDIVFSSIPGLKELTAGVRYDFSEFAALKAEYRNIRRTNRMDANALFLQVCFTF